MTYPSDAPDKPGRDVVFDKGFPRPGGFGKLVAAKLTPPDETPDHEYPFILTTGRQLEHWHTGAMTRRASVLDALEPARVASVSRGTLEKLGLKPGDMLRVTTRRGEVELGVASGRRHPRRRDLHPVRLRGSGGQHLDQPEARSVRQDPRIQVLRRARGSGRVAHAGGGVALIPARRRGRTKDAGDDAGRVVSQPHDTRRPFAGRQSRPRVRVMAAADGIQLGL